MAGKPGRIRQYIGDRYTISAQSQNKDAAWEFLKWLYSPEIMKEMYEKGMGVMAVAAANTGESDVRGIPALAPTERDVIPPPEPELPTVTPDNTTALQMIFDDPSTLEATLMDLETRYNEAYDAAVADGTWWPRTTWSPIGMA